MSQVYAGCSQAAHWYRVELSNASEVTDTIVNEHDCTLETASEYLTELQDENEPAMERALSMSNCGMDSNSESTKKVHET